MYPNYIYNLIICQKITAMNAEKNTVMIVITNNVKKKAANQRNIVDRIVVELKKNVVLPKTVIRGNVKMERMESPD